MRCSLCTFQFRCGSGVLDVAAGKGELSFDLLNLCGITCTAVEPRPLNLESCVRRWQGSAGKSALTCLHTCFASKYPIEDQNQLWFRCVNDVFNENVWNLMIYTSAIACMCGMRLAIIFPNPLSSLQ